MDARADRAGGRSDDTEPPAEAEARVELAAVLDDLELLVREDILMLDGPLGRLLAPNLMASVGKTREHLVDALARTRHSLAAANFQP